MEEKAVKKKTCAMCYIYKPFLPKDKKVKSKVCGAINAMPEDCSLPVVTYTDLPE